jgi:CRP-like cAMP-binding protein
MRVCVWLLQMVNQLHILEHFGKLVQMKMCRHLFYLRLEPGRTLVRQGNEAMTFYLVLSGCLNVMRETETIQVSVASRG